MSKPNDDRAADWRERDPNHQAEQGAYDSPVPSRQLVLDDLAAEGHPMTHDELIEYYALDDDAAEAFEHRLRAMLRDGQLLENRRGALGPIDKMDLVRGRVQGHRDGFGFLLPDETSGDDVFLAPRQMRQVMHGDRVVVHVTGRDQRGRREGRIVEVLERVNETIVGRFVVESGVSMVVPDNQRIPQEVRIAESKRGGAENNDVVTVRIIEAPSKRSEPVGEVIEVLGDRMAPGMEIEVAIRSHGIPHEFPAEVIEQAKTCGDEVAEADKKDRVDLRDLPLVTIDGADARDFDDAVYAKKTPRGYKLWVAIADVSHYVRKDSPLDVEAVERATSVYFPDHVVPMLPEALSNGLCSLNPDVDRLSVVCEMRFNAAGELQASKFYSAVIRSHARLLYEQVADWLENPDNLPARHADLKTPLDDLHGLFQAMLEQRRERGAIEFETQATKIEFNADRKIARIVPTERNVAHKIIEECMIAANVATAKYLGKRKMPLLYRVHATPTADSLEDLRSFLSERGLTLTGGDDPEAADYAKLLAQAATRPDSHLIQTVMLRSMQRAVYSPHNDGHFGLALDDYAHFTSPIRRYPDLLVHRGIKHLEAGGKPLNFDYDLAGMEALGQQCSEAERRADDATRDVDDFLKCEYMRDSLGEMFYGTVTGVTGFGLFVELEGIFATGLVHVSSLSSDFYHFDAKSRALKGERSGRVYRLADKMRVKVARVDLDERKIDFEPVEERASVRGDDEHAASPADDNKSGGGNKPGGGNKSSGKGGNKNNNRRSKNGNRRKKNSS
ncbi:ribonuclease R [Salinisphaera japonica]|uniref:Ribonuclease R n=1 Tax=Salinisphaera japonica YTM-1 TaxID=1209778 RepID=A0A423Q099_9GAMM|nr:ribonuclease R [Salinisphaera japonica]ROO31302.1 exoribonuclease R [Salinisphaera japonica YTM-1]